MITFINALSSSSYSHVRCTISGRTRYIILSESRGFYGLWRTFWILPTSEDYKCYYILILEGSVGCGARFGLSIGEDLVTKASVISLSFLLR